MQMKKIGLVLAGGGGRGAYQIGVWKALHETGLDNYITSVSGTSVGGLNAALFIQDNLNIAQNTWNSISMSKILTHKSDSDQHFKRPSFYERDGLKKIIDDNLDMRCFDNSNYNCWLTCLRKDKWATPQLEYEEIYTLPDGTKTVRKFVDGPREYFNMKYYNDEQRMQILLATSAMPFIFPKEKVDGHEYGDGGTGIYGGDNVPVKPLYEVDKCDIILIVHLDNMDEPVKQKDFPNARLHDLFPKEKVGRILDFTAEGAKKRIQQGYEENIGLFRHIREMIDSTQESSQKLGEIRAEQMQNDAQEKDLDDIEKKLLYDYARIKQKEGDSEIWR